VNDTFLFSNIGIAKDVLVHIDLGNIQAMHNGRRKYAHPQMYKRLQALRVLEPQQLMEAVGIF
jgi:hypothetical protein